MSSKPTVFEAKVPSLKVNLLSKLCSDIKKRVFLVHDEWQAIFRKGREKEFFISMSETIKYNDDDHKTVFLKTLNEQRLEGEFCDIAIVVEDVKFRAHRCVLAACSTYFKKLFKKLEVDSSSVIEIDFLRSDIFEEVLNYMYTAKISVKKEDVNLMMSSGQILGIRFLDKLCSQKRDVSSPEDTPQSKNKYCLKINRAIGESNDNQDDEVEEIGDHDDSPSDMTMEGTPPSQEDGKSPTATLRVQEAILKELGSEEVRKVNCYGQEVESVETAESKDLGSQTPQALTYNDGISEVKDEQTPAWTTAAGDMKFEYLLYGHREQIACQACLPDPLDSGCPLSALLPCQEVAMVFAPAGDKSGNDQEEARLQNASKQIVHAAIQQAIQQLSQERQTKEKGTSSAVSLQLERRQSTKKHEKK
ncbi:hypothetical protein JRQ81_012608 [Phrynocephalus forsythii]|uniref:BTB domain-containing protein n=1 Tax=Phrynocephalus forsythii TaxID=171643 RepID=A0A9Q1B5X4_9SAUR|nr:hypothetical protein JRQ81_012608 [Phrynocephalus forsythii]